MSRRDEPEYSKEGVEYEGPPGGLEALLSSRSILSEVVTVEHAGDRVEVIFRELSNDLKQKIMAHAIQHVEDQRRIQEEGGKGEWRDSDADRDVLICEERDLRMLQAAMLDPKTKGPACSLAWLRRRMGTQLQTMLGERYATFERSVDPQHIDEDVIKMVIDDVKKNTPLDLLLMAYGSVLLARCVQYLVALHWNSATDKSSGSPSGETQPIETPSREG